LSAYPSQFSAGLLQPTPRPAANPKTLVINAEIPYGSTEADLGKIGEFLFTASCVEISGQSVQMILFAVNNTNELLFIYEHDGTLHDIAPGFPMGLWGATVVVPEIVVTRSGDGALPLATQELSNFYDFELIAAALDGSNCRFVGEVTLFVGGK
jgi:hypothetical protein